ncbi:MAG: ATP-binding cassette domain-containing protein [Deltaproteobacteria bacterium]|nr:ATP-binding cassette domain-containing protein [Deltaproteobacteria bacterium]
MIEVANLQKKFNSHTALAGVSFRVEPGEIYSYLGPNGAGKTTTIRILTGLTRSDDGIARLNGYSINDNPLEYKAQFGLVPQHTNLDADLSVQENLVIHGWLYGMARQEIKLRIDELLDYIGLIDRRKTLVKRLSGGQKRRLLIARALLHRPKVLFLDEPSVGLDPAIRRSLWGVIKKVKGEGATVFLTTHYIEEAEFLADRVAFLDAGSIVTEDKPAHLMSQIGEWAIDTLQSKHIRSFYFQTRLEAEKWASVHEGEFTLRRVNLEDAFLAKTGKKVG